MADLITEIVSQEAIDNIRLLTSLLKQSTEQMDDAIATAANFNKSLTGNSVKTADAALSNYNATQEKLIQTESERLNIERQIKIEGEKMAAAVKMESNAIDQAANTYKVFANSQKDLAQYIQQLSQRLSEVKQQIKEVDKNATNYAEATANLRLEQAKLQSEMAETTLELKRTIKEQKYADDSMKGMSVRLQQLKDVYTMFTEEERRSDFGMTISAGINELDEKLKGLDKSIGDNQRSVGNYEVATKSFRTQLKEIVQELTAQKIAYEQMNGSINAAEKELRDIAAASGKESAVYKEKKLALDALKDTYNKTGIAISQLEQQGGKLSDTMRDASSSLRAAGDDAGNSKAMAEGVGVLADSFSVFQAGMVAMGANGEDLMQIYAKMMILQQGLNGITQITNALQKESILMLKLKSLWQKVSLVFTQKQTAATVAETAAETSNVASTTAAATATAGLAAAEGVATKASWTLTGSLKAVGTAIKSIPVVGWILAAVAALGTLTILLYKHLNAEKELSKEQKNRISLQKDINAISMKANESTLENITKLKLLQKELGNVKQGSSEWKSIVDEINNLTGLQLDAVKDTKKEIEKATAAWVNQYKVMAKAEATIQQIVESELEFERLRSEYFQSGTDPKRRKEIADQLKLDDKQIKNMLEITDLYKSNKKMSAEFKQNKYDEVKNIWEIAKQNLIDYNQGLENTITLDGLLTQEIARRDKLMKVDNLKNYYIEYIKLRAELYLSGEELINENTRIELELLENKYQYELKQLKEKNKSTEDLTKLHQLEIQKIQRDGFAKLEEFRQKNFENVIQYRIKEEEENKKKRDSFIESAKQATEGAQIWFNKYLDNQQKILEMERQANLERLQSVNDLIGSFSSLGSAIAQNIKDEKERIIVEQRIAEVQIALSHAIAIAQVLIDEGDPYLKAIRIAANLAAIATGFIQAESAISQAKTAAYAEGTDYHKGGGAVIGEGGQPELLKVGGVTTWITQPTYFPNLPIGASVTPLSDMEQDKNMNDYWLEKIANGSGSSVNINISERLLPTLRKDAKVIRFANKLIQARG